MDGQITKILQIKTESQECETSSYKVPLNPINSRIERCLTKHNTTLPPQAQEHNLSTAPTSFYTAACILDGCEPTFLFLCPWLCEQPNMSASKFSPAPICTSPGSSICPKQ